MAAEIKAQELVHALEHGGGRRWIVLLLIIAFALFQSVAQVLINPMNLVYMSSENGLPLLS